MDFEHPTVLLKSQIKIMHQNQFYCFYFWAQFTTLDDTGTVKVSWYFNQPTFDARQITIIPHSWMPAASEHGCTVVCTVPFKL